MNRWRDRVPTSGTLKLPPDPRSLEALGRNHAFETAIADLVDNSIDAGAKDVLIRFVRAGGRLRGLYVVDNGKGIPASAIDAAMTVGGPRDYTGSELGHFGLGLKAASFSQARSLTVLTRAEDDMMVGRRWLLDRARSGFLCDVVPEGFARAELDRPWGIPWAGVGTVVRWDDVTAFPSVANPDVIERFVTSAVTKLQHHLGLVFHRILGEGAVAILVDVEDVDAGMAGPRFEVESLDPFGYQRSGRTGYPRTLTGEVEGAKIELVCHVCPGRSSLPGFKLPGGVLDWQGFYCYRNDRLLQAGGWNGVQHPDRQWQLARVRIDVPSDSEGLFRMNPEKSRVEVGPDFARLVAEARGPEGKTFEDYLQDARETFKHSRRRNRNRPHVVPPGKGFDPRVRRVIARELPFLEGEEPIDIRWKWLEDDSFLEVDRETRTLWINYRYREAVIGATRGSLNDVPLLKALLYLLTEEVFRGAYLGSRDKDNIEVWRQILTAAAKREWS